MSAITNRFRSTTRARLRDRRNQRAFVRAYEQASPSMQAELLAISQYQKVGH